MKWKVGDKLVNADGHKGQVNQYMIDHDMQTQCEAAGWTMELDGKPYSSSHYVSKREGLEAIDVIEAFDLNRNLANVCKYILRCNHKGQRDSDLEKAINYLWRERYGTWLPKFEAICPVAGCEKQIHPGGRFCGSHGHLSFAKDK